MTSEDQGATRPARTNGYDPDKVQDFVDRIESLYADIASEMGSAMSSCQQIHGDIKTVLQEAKDEIGIPKKALRKVIKARALERKAQDCRDDLEGEDQDSFDMIRHALGDLADLPLGQAAVHAAEETREPKQPRKRKGKQVDLEGAIAAAPGSDNTADTSTQPFRPDDEARIAAE